MTTLPISPTKSNAHRTYLFVALGGALWISAYQIYEPLADWINSPVNDEVVANGAKVTWAEAGFEANDALTFGLGLTKTHINRLSQMRVAAILKGFGFVATREWSAKAQRQKRIWRREDNL